MAQAESIKRVTVHPLVLLSVVDHFTRSVRNCSNKRVVGVLLGSRRKDSVDVSNSFAVPFDEDNKDSDVWFLDHDYLATMFSMFKKVTSREKVVGWYHTGPLLRPNDLKINEVFRTFCSESVLVIIGATTEPGGMPTSSYIAVEEVHDDGTPTTKTFEHIPTEIAAEEAEEVGVEHLLRDLKTQTIGTLSQMIRQQLHALSGLKDDIAFIQGYIEDVAAGKLPPDVQIMYLLQDILNLLPGVSLDTVLQPAVLKANDSMAVIYLASMIRAVVALHNLVDNKIQNREWEKEEGKESRSKGATSKDASAKSKDGPKAKDGAGTGDKPKDGGDKSKSTASKSKEKEKGAKK